MLIYDVLDFMLNKHVYVDLWGVRLTLDDDVE